MTEVGFTKAGTNARSIKPSANRCCSRKTTTPARCKACCEDSTTSSHQSPRPSLCVPRSEPSTTSQSTSDATLPYGAWVGAELSAENKCQLWIPEGFAHGFLILSSVAEVQYKTRGSGTNPVNGPSSGMIQIWPYQPLDRLQGAEVSLSGKDAEAAGFKAAEVAGDVFP